MSNIKKRNLRAESARVLHDILESGKSARDCLPAAQANFSEQDRAWMQEMVYGVLRNLPLLQFWLRQLLDKPLKARFKVIEHLIMLGFYQIAFSRVSDHAAVSETVAGCKSLKAEALKGLTNALLRNFIRQDIANQVPQGGHILSGLPKWLFKKLQAQYDVQLPALIESMQNKPPIWLRVNQLKTTRVAYMALLDEHGIAHAESAEHPDGLILHKPRDITSLPGFDEGLFAVQDGAAQLAAAYLMPKKNERILDCCAAPGGKTCHILEVQPDVQACLALDVDAQRLTRVAENLNRLGHKATLVTGDAGKPDSWWDGQQFDRILLDAPCSATGIIRRHPDIKWLRKNNDIQVLVELQQQILENIWPLLKPGGTLLYATCSILPEENTQQVANFLQKTANARLSNITESENELTPGRQILPGEGQMDGFYYARLLKSID